MQLFVEKRFSGIQADALCWPVAPNVALEKLLANASKEQLVQWKEAVTVQGFKGELGQTALLPGYDGARWMLLVGVGTTVGREVVREVTGTALQHVTAVGARTVALQLAGFCESDMTMEIIAQAAAEAALLRAYRYEVYKKGPEKKVGQLTLLVDDARQRTQALKGVARAEQINAGVTLARDLVNAPPHEMSPDRLAETAQQIAKASKGMIKAKILDREQCEKLGMEAYLAVAKGSQFPPRFIHLTYSPEKATKKTLAVVGKGITFDSGGLSLKPADAMMTMKCDMAGAAAVLGFFHVLTVLRPKVRVEGIIAACENMPSGNAMRPGDIVRASNGKTIEILNTDAEGRLTLADALHYAVGLKPQAIIDLATLTGACIVGLGEEISGLMSNDEDATVQVLAAADRAGEKMWEMPLEKRYRSQVESDVADLRNIATSRYGGSLTAGLFLQEFVDNTPWVHLDIAGPAYAERPMSSYLGKGGTGHGVRTLVEFVEHWK